MHKEEDITSRERLQVRMAANRQSSSNFDDWCLQQWPENLPEGDVLDLGCGTGKQVRLFAPLLPTGARFHALDLSPDSLHELAPFQASNPKVQLHQGSFDQLPPLLAGSKFALVYSAYALYYTQDLSKLLTAISNMLLPGGRFWLIGPAPGNNRAFLDILEAQYPTDAFLRHVSEGFAQEVRDKATALGLHAVRSERLENEIRYESPAAFMAYLKNTLYYQSGHDAAILKGLQENSAPDGSFTVTKCVASLQFQKPLG